MTLPAEQILREFAQLTVEDQVQVGHEVLARLLQLIAQTGRSSPGVAAWLAAGPPHARSGARPLGLLRGQLSVADDFDAPLSDADLRAFEGGP